MLDVALTLGVLSSMRASLWFALVVFVISYISFGTNQIVTALGFFYLMLIVSATLLCSWLATNSSIFKEVSSSLNQILLVVLLLASLEHPTFLGQLISVSVTTAENNFEMYLALLSSVFSLTAVIVALVLVGTVVLEISVRILLGSGFSNSNTIYDVVRTAGVFTLICLSTSGLLDFFLGSLLKSG
jgi:hypothetical protein